MCKPCGDLFGISLCPKLRHLVVFLSLHFVLSRYTPHQWVLYEREKEREREGGGGGGGGRDRLKTRHPCL